MATVRNPILPGFHPDPSICRVGDEYYIANSTFEWFPGVRLHRSRELVKWTPCGHALTRPSQLDLVGNDDSGGIWAPCLTHADGHFWLIYTNVKNWENKYKEAKNYLLTAPAIEGPWSEPIFLNGIGFDPSLFHDEDGRKWLVQMEWNHHSSNVPGFFAGIVLQEYSVFENRLVGPRKKIFQGTPRGLTEGPHLCKRNGYYYLLTAEGGTLWEHAATLARSRHIEGPYEVDPAGHLLCAEQAPDHPLQKTGHACFVEGDDDDWWIVYLCSRPLAAPAARNCPLGRETALAPARWTDDGWLRLVGSSEAPAPSLAVEIPIATNEQTSDWSKRDDFLTSTLDDSWQTLRVPASSDWFSLTARPGWLRLVGRESFFSRHHQSLVARRLQSIDARAETLLDFLPAHPQQMAGLAAYYDTTKHFALHVTWHEQLGRVLDLLTSTHLPTQPQLDAWPLVEPIALPATGPVRLAVEFSGPSVQFFYTINESNWRKIGPILPLSELADESPGCHRFTGCMIALYAQDFTGSGLVADFDYFDYLEKT